MPYKRTREEITKAAADHEYLRIVGSFAMQHTIVSLYSPSTMVKTPETTIRGRWAINCDDFSGEQLLLNYRPDSGRMAFQLGIGRFFEPDAGITSCHADLGEDLAGAITLPKPKKIKLGLSTVVADRRSVRDFSGAPVSLVDLATILSHAQGVTGELPYRDPISGTQGAIKVRTVASGGGLYPITLLIHAINVSGLPQGTYEYLPYAHSLAPLPVDGEITEALKSHDLDITKAGFALTFVYDLYRNSRKYGDSGLVFALIETGGILQNTHLTRTALALAGCDQGGYDKQRIEQAVGLDGVTRHVVHVTFIGQEG